MEDDCGYLLRHNRDYIAVVVQKAVLNQQGISQIELLAEGRGHQ